MPFRRSRSSAAMASDAAMQRRHLVLLASGSLALGPGILLGAEAAVDDDPVNHVHRLASGWRAVERAGEPKDRVGIIELDWHRQQVRVVADLPAPGRAHGVLAMHDGGFLAVGTRPGQWLIRCDAEGRVVSRIVVGQEMPVRTFNGHVDSSADGQWLFTTETDSPTGTSWISVRDPRTLHRVNHFTSAGFDAHQCLGDAQGNLVVAHGGILRADDGRKINLERMTPSLSQIDPESGEIIGQWRLPDRRLSIRHLAWSRPPEGSLPDGKHPDNNLSGARHAVGKPLLGIGLQAEHDEASRRRDAPALALWRGGDLMLPTADAQAAGYVGDIAAGPAGGFVLSAQKAGRGLWWQPRAAQTLTKVAELTDVCALAPWPTRSGTGVLIGSARGVALWHPAQQPRMLPWPAPMLPDNHWVLLSRG